MVSDLVLLNSKIKDVSQDLIAFAEAEKDFSVLQKILKKEQNKHKKTFFIANYDVKNFENLIKNNAFVTWVIFEANKTDKPKKVFFKNFTIEGSLYRDDEIQKFFYRIDIIPNKIEKLIFYPQNDRRAILIFQNKTVTCNIKPSFRGLTLNKLVFDYFLNGYVAIKKESLPKNFDAESKIEVHGGITFQQKFGKFMVFGFDCAHAGDEDNKKLKDPRNVYAEIIKMEDQLIKYSRKK